MKRLSILTFVLMSFFGLRADAAKVKVEHVHPLCWWAGMKNPVLQVLIHGEGVGTQPVALKDAQGIAIEEVVTQENPNYLILYLNTREAKPQKFVIQVGRQSIPYELKAREARHRSSFDSSDVLYLLMPDRFANGNPKNDVVKGMLEQTCDVGVPMARHGGDLAGMVQHLDYLAELGITAIWPTPTLVNDMPKESYHGYAITNYYLTDPRLGTNEEYRRFVEEAHGRGIKIVKDIVFNHCGRQNFLFADMPQRDWFNFEGRYVQSSYRTGAFGDVHASQFDRQRTTDGWFVEAMPDLNQRNRLVMDYLIQASVWWIEWAGIDGFRQDTYPYNDFDGMRKWCERIELEYPGFNIVGETWMNNNVGIAYWQKDSRLSAPRNSLLKTVMDFPLMSLLNYVMDEETDEWNHGYARLYEYLSQDVVYADVNHLLTFLDNHDTDRFQKNVEMAQDTTRYKHALTLLLTLRGIPQLYYGDEIGMAADKSKGDGALRQDFPGGWKNDRNNAFTKEGRTELQNWYFDFAKNLLNWRKNCEAVHDGRLIHFHVRNGVYVYAREKNGKVVTVVVNGTKKNVTVDLSPYQEVLPRGEAMNVLTHKRVKCAGEMRLRPKEIRVLDFTL